MLFVYLKNGERIEVVKSLKLSEGYFLMLVKDDQGERVQVFASEEIDRVEADPESEPRAA